MYNFPNPNNDKWISKYNDLVNEVASNQDYYKEYKKTQPKRNDKAIDGFSADNVTIHHIIPKKIDMSLVKDKNNLLYIPFNKHCDLHYYLWKSNKEYALHLWFICLAARKMKIWDLPGGEIEYKQLKKDLSYCIQLKKKNKNEE